MDILYAFCVTAQTQSPPPQNLLVQLFPFFILGIIMYYIFFRLPRKEQAKRENMLNSIKSGDRIITAGGIYGTIAQVKEKSFLVRIADNVKIEISRSGISGVIEKSGEENDSQGAKNSSNQNGKGKEELKHRKGRKKQ